jgi:hypothetical protein
MAKAVRPTGKLMLKSKFLRSDVPCHQYRSRHSSSLGSRALSAIERDLTALRTANCARDMD